MGKVDFSNWDEYYSSLADRYKGILTDQEVNEISEMVVCCAGTGGSSAWTALVLARLGVRYFKVADPDNYEISNINRQPGAKIDTLGRNKAEVIAEEIMKLSPRAKVDVYREGVTEENVSEFLKDGTVVLDGIDLYELAIKCQMFMLAHQKKLPVFSCPILGWGAAILVFDPEKSPTFEEYFGKVPLDQKSLEHQKYVVDYAKKYFLFWPNLDLELYLERIRDGKPPSVGTSAMLAGLLLGNAVIDYVFKKGNFPVVPMATHIDLMELKIKKSRTIKKFTKMVDNSLKKTLSKKPTPNDEVAIV